MKFYLLLLLLLPVCAGQLYEVKCYESDVAGGEPRKLTYRNKNPLACYTKNDGGFGADFADICKKSFVKCCYSDYCNNPNRKDVEVKIHHTNCYERDNVNKVAEKINCQGKNKMSCYTKDDGKLGCCYAGYCKEDGVKCCYTDYCNKPRVTEKNNGRRYEINCYARFVGEEAQKTYCSAMDRIACYSKKDGELGCYDLTDCEKPGVHCCHVDYCNKPLDAF